MTIKQFFQKCLGNWESTRLYMYPSSGKIVTTTTYFEWQYNNQEDFYKVNWVNPSFSNGSMNIRLRGDFYLDRDKGYFTGEETTSIVKSVSSTTLHTTTTYGGVMYDEFIQFLTNNTRFRRTIGYKVDEAGNKTGDVTLVGSYVEKRICQEKEDLEIDGDVENFL